MKTILASLLLIFFSSLAFADLPPPTIGATCKTIERLGGPLKYCWKANKTMGIAVQQTSKHGLRVWKNSNSYTTGGQYHTIVLQSSPGDKVGITATQEFKKEPVEIKVVQLIFP